MIIDIFVTYHYYLIYLHNKFIYYEKYWYGDQNLHLFAIVAVMSRSALFMRTC